MLAEAIHKTALIGRVKVAIGLNRVSAGIIDSLKKASHISDIVVVGEYVEGFECITIDAGESRDSHIASTLATALQTKAVEAVVRGNVDFDFIISDFAPVFGYKKIPRVTIVLDVHGHEFMMTPASIMEGNSVNERLEMAIAAAEYLKSFAITPRVGIIQLDDYRGHTDEIDQSIDEAHYISEQLSRQHIEVAFRGYAIEKAVQTCNLIIPRNGIIGNAIWRSITGIGGCRDLGDIGLINEVFVDDSKYWDDYYQPILFAAAMANRKKSL